jgi:hypothetical protein
LCPLKIKSNIHFSTNILIKIYSRHEEYRRNINKPKGFICNNE